MRSQSRKTTSITIEIGFNHLRAGRLKEAAAIANQLLSANPNHHGALNLSGLIALNQGERERAVRQFQRAVKLNRSEPIYQCNLGAAYRQSHRYPEAIAACQKNREALAVNPDDYAQYIDQLIAHFTPEFFQRTQGMGNPSTAPVFIVGMPRSGTTLTEQILASFPNAKIIHCRRDVRDVAVSCWMTQFKSILWAFDLTHIAERIKQYWRIMEHWRRVLPVPMLEIDYEETVAEQTAQTLRLLDFIGLEWDDACMQFHKTDRLVHTASVTQVRQPIYKRSIERWRSYEDALQPLLERLSLETVNRLRREGSEAVSGAVEEAKA